MEGSTPKKEKNRLIHEIRKDIRCKMIIVIDILLGVQIYTGYFAGF